MKEKSESSVIWHKVKPFSHDDPKKQNTVTCRKKNRRHGTFTHCITPSTMQMFTCRLEGAVREEGWTEFMSQDESQKKKKKKAFTVLV